MISLVIFLDLYFFTRMWRSTQTRPRPWPTPWTWPRWTASPTSTRCCASWPPAAWCRPSTSAREWTATSTTTASLLPYTHTSRRLLGGLTSCAAPLDQMHFDIHSNIWTSSCLSSLSPQVRRYHSAPPASSSHRSRHHLPRSDGQTQAVGPLQQPQLQT